MSWGRCSVVKELIRVNCLIDIYYIEDTWFIGLFTILKTDYIITFKVESFGSSHTTENNERMCMGIAVFDYEVDWNFLRQNCCLLMDLV